MRSSTRMTMAAGAATMLASAPIGSTMREQRWVLFAWTGVVVITLAHLLARWARVPAVLLPVAGLLGLVVYLTAIFTPDNALLGMFPTADSLSHLRDQVAAGFGDVRSLTTPAPATRGLILLAAGGIGLVAIMVDIVAVSMRQPAASGLILLVMYAVPTAVAFDGVGWLPFALGASGYLVLLFSEGYERMVRWGRPVPYDDIPGQEPNGWPVRISGRRIGVAALAVAVLLPLAIPGFSSNTLGFLTGSGGEGGGQTQGGSALSPFARMHDQLSRPEPQVLMSVETTQEDPYYIRQMVLDRFTSNGDWSMNRLDEGQDADDPLEVPPGEPLSGSEDHFLARFEITTTYRDTTLPIYGMPRSFADLPGNWRYNPERGTAFSRSGTTRGLEYGVEYVDTRPTVEQLRASAAPGEQDEMVRVWGSLPDDLPEEVFDAVEEIVDGAGTQYDRALAIYEYFTGSGSGFTYSLETVEGESGNALVDFLTEKQGFCQQYSSAMAIMLRVAGVPSRVAVGYTIGQPEDDNIRVITTNDAHAWVEAYFADVGWVPFDPTPLRDGRSISLPWTERPDDGQPSDAAEPTAPGSDPSAVQTNPDALPEENPFVAVDGDDDQGLVSPGRMLGGIALLLAVVLLISPMLARQVVRRHRLRSAAESDPKRAAHSAWDEVLASAEDLRVTVRSTESPRSTALRLIGELNLTPQTAAGLRLTALAEERARYAPDARVDGDLPAAVHAVRRGLRPLASRRQKWRAALAPPSVLRETSERMARRTTELISTLDRVAVLGRRLLLMPRRLFGRP